MKWCWERKITRKSEIKKSHSAWSSAPGSCLWSRGQPPQLWFLLLIIQGKKEFENNIYTLFNHYLCLACAQTHTHTQNPVSRKQEWVCSCYGDTINCSNYQRVVMQKSKVKQRWRNGTEARKITCEQEIAYVMVKLRLLLWLGNIFYEK